MSGRRPCRYSSACRGRGPECGSSRTGGWRCSR
uniref:Uncharacterized protein n=1 Tax=Arundo donax TaxID=35708 RepID=A0A0A8XWQ4_ARUDO